MANRSNQSFLHPFALFVFPDLLKAHFGFWSLSCNNRQVTNASVPLSFDKILISPSCPIGHPWAWQPCGRQAEPGARKGRSLAGADAGGLGQEGQLAVVQMHDSMIEMKAIRISSASVG
jgi:hypothetical protein